MEPSSTGEERDADGADDASRQSEREPATDDAPRWSLLRRRLAPLLLVAGGLAAAVVFQRHAPREHRVALRLDDAGTITAVDVTWAAIGEQDGESVQGGSWRFAAGSAPSQLRTSVRFPDGRYDLDVSVERGAEHRAFHRVITLDDADAITVPVR